ncbi:MAG: tripartite tricarboxylate transporter substrate-binding protein [Gemmatimonadaceae bacterium]
MRPLTLAFAMLPLHALFGQGAVPDITIHAPAAPGGGWDQTARVMQHVLRSTGLARSVQVVNAAGAAGTIGLARFVSAERGNPNALLVTGLVMVSGIAANQSPVTLADVTPIARLSGEYEVIVVPASSPFRSLRDLTDAFRANPRAISWGGGSAGGTDDILVRLLADRVGVPRVGVNYIAYSGGGQALAAVLGAHVSAAVSGLGEFASQIEAGQLRALAISAPPPGRAEGIDIPTFHEQGVDLTLLNWRGVVAPPGISRQERRALERLVEQLAARAEWKEVLQRNGWVDLHLQGPEFDRFLTSEIARVAPLVAQAQGAGARDYFGLFVLLGAATSLVAVAMGAVKRPGGATPVTPTTDAGTLGILTLAFILDIALFETLGFVLASAVMFVLVARAFGSRRLARDAVVGLGLALLVFAGFTSGLGISLPAGVLG